jgi:hypothetical protein
MDEENPNLSSSVCAWRETMTELAVAGGKVGLEVVTEVAWGLARTSWLEPGI